MVKRVLRSKTFNIGTEAGFKKAWDFYEKKLRIKRLKFPDDVWSESYGVGKRRQIPRMVVYWYTRPVKKKLKEVI